MTKEQIGNILKELRISSGMTQKEVAEKLSRNQPIVGHWETGYSQPDANTLFTLCDIYGTTVDEAFGFKKEKVSISKKDLDMLKKYHSLDPQGQEHINTVLGWESTRVASLTGKDARIKELEEAVSENCLVLNAAHERTDIDITDEI